MPFMQTSQLLSPCGPTHIRALDIDEILFHILERLLRPSAESLLTFNEFDSPNDHEIPPFKPSYAPMLVCRRWYSIGRQVALSWARLNPDIWHFDRPCFPNPFAHVSQLHYTFPSLSTDGCDDISRLLADLETEDSANMLSPMPRLRELWLFQISATAAHILSLSNIFQRNNITFLELSAKNCFDNPKVCWTSLFFAVVASPTSRLPHLRHLSLRDGHIDQSSDACFSRFPMRLSTLSLERVALGIESFRKLLLHVSSPSLERLSVVFSHSMVLVGLSKVFVEKWATLCQNLRWIKLGSAVNFSTICVNLAICFPQAKRIEVFHVREHLKCVAAVSHKLTRLEVISSGRDVGHTPVPYQSIFQDFLRSQEAAQMQEVILPGLLYDPSIFDPTLYEFTASGGVVKCPSWSCSSSLSTLVLCLKARTFLGRSRGCDTYPVDSRVVCGFIAANCPELRSLDLRFTQANFDLDPEGGLCFLGRLSKLEHLKIRASGYLRMCKAAGWWDGEYAPWPYDTPLDRALVQGDQAALAAVPHATGQRLIPIPVLRWLAVKPTECDREQGLTNLARCDYLLNTVIENDFARIAKRLSTVVRPQWRLRLQAMLAEARDQKREGSCWGQLKTFHCHLQPRSSPTANTFAGMAVNKDVLAFAARYQEALQEVLPHVEVAVHTVFRVD